MIQVRRAGERGRTRSGWLDSRHTFSFGDSEDPRERSVCAGAPKAQILRKREATLS
jgi:hypothetical protein